MRYNYAMFATPGLHLEHTILVFTRFKEKFSCAF